MTSAISTEGLSKRYGGTLALDSLSLNIREGEVYGYLGPNGAGKTTTIRLLLGLHRPSSGTARLFGIDCWRDPVAAHRRVAYVFLSFLPMLPTQILLNNLLYHASEMAIPTDNVDEEQLQRPAHWDAAFIRRFMTFFGPISSIFDFATFGIMIWSSTRTRRCSDLAGSSNRWRPRASSSSRSARGACRSSAAGPAHHSRSRH